MENVQVTTKVAVENMTQGKKTEVNPEMFQALLGMLVGKTDEELPELKIMPGMEKSEEVPEIIGELMGEVETEEQLTTTNHMAYLFQNVLKPEVKSEVNKNTPTTENADPVMAKDSSSSEIKAVNPEAVMGKPLETMEKPVTGKEDKVQSKLSQTNTDNNKIVDKLREIDTGQKSTEETSRLDFQTELAKVSGSKADKSQNPGSIDNLKIDDATLITEVKLGQDKQLHIQKLPQQQDVKIQQNLEKIEVTMVKMIHSVKEGDATKMTVTLEPESLGKVDLDLRMENGKITARIFVENNQVRELFDGKLHELTTNLQKLNINIEKIQLQVNQGTESQQMDMGQQGSFGRHQKRQGWQNNQNYLFGRIDESLSTGHRENTQEGLSILA